MDIVFAETKGLSLEWYTVNKSADLLTRRNTEERLGREETLEQGMFYKPSHETMTKSTTFLVAAIYR